MKNKIPNVFIIGSAKAGTSSFSRYLRLHEEVFIPKRPKEPNFMAFNGITPNLGGPGDLENAMADTLTSLDDYVRLYSNWNSEPVAADCSPHYLYFAERSSSQILELRPDAKIIAVLRNPVECAFSMYCMMRQSGREPVKNFLDAFNLSEQRYSSGWEIAWNYKDYFKISDKVRTYVQSFPEKQLLLLRYETLRDKPAQFFKTVCDFLGVSYKPPVKREISENRRMNWRDLIYKKLRRSHVLSRSAAGISSVIPRRVKRSLFDHFLDTPVMRLRTKEKVILQDIYRSDIENLQALLGWDLQEWLE